MRALPPEPAPGDKITAELVREIIRCIRERQILKSTDYTVSSGPNGTTIKIKPGAGKKQGKGGKVDHDTLYYADDESIQNAPFSGSGSTHVVESNAFELKGFGRFDRDQTGEAGIFVASSELELGTEAMSGASVLVRFGDSDTVNGNTLGYAKLKLPESIKSPPTPFQYVEVPDEEQQGATIKSIVNCVFYFDGEQKTLPDYSSVPESGTVYLTGTQPAKQEGATEEPPWQFAMATTPATAPTGGKVMNVKLYDFSGGKVSMDYRTTFLTLSAGSKGDKGDSASITVTSSSYTPTGGGSGIGFTFQPQKNGQADGDSAGLGIEIEENQPTTGDPGGFTLKFIRAKNGQAEGNPVTVTISNGAKGDPGSLTGTVVFLHDVTWDASNHTLVKHWASLDLATGAVTDASTPAGKTAAISTTPISSLLPSESGGGS